MRSIRLSHADPRQRGHAHGEAFRDEIRDLAGIRFELLERRSPIKGRERLLELAAAHLPVLNREAPELGLELEGIAEGSGVSAPELVVLNHYTDIRDVRTPIQGEEGGCSIVYGVSSEGPTLGQTWDMHGTAEPFVTVLEVEVPGGIPTIVFTVMGCLGMMGLNAEGVAVCINNLTPTDGRVGLLWPALVRQLLGYGTALEAHDHLMRAHLGSGHNYFIADEQHAWNVETTGLKKVVTAHNPASSYWHTNHYLEPELKALEAPLYPTSTTLERYDRLCQVMGGGQDWTVPAIKEILGSHDGYPRSICSHLKGDGDPSASKTCGAVVCDLQRRQLHAAPGCVHEAEYKVFSFERGEG